MKGVTKEILKASGEGEKTADDLMKELTTEAMEETLDSKTVTVIKKLIAGEEIKPANEEEEDESNINKKLVKENTRFRLIFRGPGAKDDEVRYLGAFTDVDGDICDDSRTYMSIGSDAKYKDGNCFKLNTDNELHFVNELRDQPGSIWRMTAHRTYSDRRDAYGDNDTGMSMTNT